ncbi:hypothetical protein V8D89_012179 [Ganoderma adspersum]
MWTAESTETVDALIQDAYIYDDALHARARQCLELLTAQLSGPPWVERMQNAIPQVPAFSTLRLFQALYATADELGLVSGKRYVSATICACCDHIIPGAAGLEGQRANLVQALDDISSTWAAFVLGHVIYAHGADDSLNSVPGSQALCDSTPRTESERIVKLQRVRDQQRRWKEEVMSRDNCRCFMCGCYDTDWFFRQQPQPNDAGFHDCDVVPIIKREVLVQDEDPSEGIMAELESLDAHSNIMRSILKHYFGADAEALLKKAVGPQNTLFVNSSACHGYRRFRWCLHPTMTPNRYKIKRYGLTNYLDSRHVTRHVSFVDHSQSLSQAEAVAEAGNMPVDLPDPALLRLHDALAGVLWRSGAVAAFDRLFARPHWLPLYSRWPAPRGTAFWTSVVEYAGAETCLEVDLDLSVEALRDSMRVDLAHLCIPSRDGSPSRD